MKKADWNVCVYSIKPSAYQTVIALLNIIKGKYHYFYSTDQEMKRHAE